MIAGQDATTANVTGLANDTTHEIELRAQNSAGYGAVAEASARTQIANLITRFTLIDALSQFTRHELEDDARVDLADYASNTAGKKMLGIQVEVSDVNEVGRVEYALDGPMTHTQTERYRPGPLFGDQGRFDVHGRSFLTGSYTVTATAYGTGSSATLRWRHERSRSPW